MIEKARPAPNISKKQRSEIRTLHRFKRKLFLEAADTPSSLDVFRLALWNLAISQNTSHATKQSQPRVSLNLARHHVVRRSV